MKDMSLFLHGTSTIEYLYNTSLDYRGGKSLTAVFLLEHALRTQRHALGKYNRVYLTLLERLAFVYEEMECFDQYNFVLKECVDIMNVTGETSPDIMIRIGFCFEQEGDMESA